LDQEEIRKEQWKYLYSIFPFIDFPFAILSIIYSQHWIITLCMAPLFPIIGGGIMKLSQKRNFQPGAYIFPINGTLFLIFAYIAGYNSPSWLMMINITIGSSFMLGNARLGQIFMGINCLSVGVLYYWMGASLLYSLIILFSLLSFLVLFARTYSYLQLQQARIESKNKEVEAQKQEIIASINYAKRIQEAIFPSDKLVKEYLPNSFVLYKPKDIVAGDFYWMEHKNNKILFAAADCTGHGVPGAMVSVICNNALNRSVREYGLTNPGEILDKARKIVIQEFEKSDEEVQDGMDIALCSLEGNKLQYAGAHNPLWLIRNGEIVETKANKQPIGKFYSPLPYTTHSFDLEKEDTLYIFSDGYVDQFGGEKGKKFKAKAFRELLLAMQDKTMEEQRSLIEETFEKWRGNIEQIDDVCVIGIRI
jgi:serine phosphatase RsbU (regulator of sigma subunit)